MQSQEKQEAIEKIKSLIESGSHKNFQLALQLMESLEVKKEVLELYNLKEKDITESLIYWTMPNEDFFKERRYLSEKFERILILRIFHKKLRRQCWSIFLDLIYLFGIILHNDLWLKTNIILEFQEKYLSFQFSGTYKLKNIQEHIKTIDMINKPQTKMDLIHLFKSVQKDIDKYRNFSEWFYIRKTTTSQLNPVIYQVESYKENQDFGIFTVNIKIDI